MNGKTTVATSQILKGKNIALYFSAHWCPPCRGFTPKLVKTYNAMKAAVDEGKREDFEFVFVSSDKDKSAFDDYYGEMPWLAQPYENRKGKAALSDLFEVQGIPTLITLDADGKIINKAARGAASGDPEGKDFPWWPKALNDVNAVTDGLNEEICIVTLLVGANDADKAKKLADIKAVATKYYADAKAKKTESKYRFFFEDGEGGVSSQIRKLCGGVKGDKTIILNLSDSGSFYVANKEGDVAGLIPDFEKASLEKKTINQ